jgi:mRNA interferase MazF
MPDSQFGELAWGVFIASLDPAKGTEQAGTRPVVIVSDEDFNQRWEQVAILPLTSRKVGRPLFPAEVLLPAGTAALERESIILAHQVRVISKERLERKVGHLPGEFQDQVRSALRLYLNL